MAKKKAKKNKVKSEVLAGNVRAVAFGKQDMTPTSAADWKRAPAPTDHVPLPLPSGNTCLVMPLGVAEVLKRGLIPNPLISTVTSVIEVAELKTKNPTKEQVKAAEKASRKKLADEMEAWAGDPSKMASVLDMADAITIACVVQPPVSPVPEPDEDGTVSRDPSVLYVDQVDLDDKLYIMSHAMSGVRDLNSFRREVAGSLGSGADGEVVPAEAQ